MRFTTRDIERIRKALKDELQNQSESVSVGAPQFKVISPHSCFIQGDVDLDKLTAAVALAFTDYGELLMKKELFNPGPGKKRTSPDVILDDEDES